MGRSWCFGGHTQEEWTRACSMDLRERVLRDSDAGMMADAVAEMDHVT
jgi:hypothetical protein